MQRLEWYVKNKPKEGKKEGYKRNLFIFSI